MPCIRNYIPYDFARSFLDAMPLHPLCTCEITSNCRGLVRHFLSVLVIGLYIDY